MAKSKKTGSRKETVYTCNALIFLFVIMLAYTYSKHTKSDDVVQTAKTGCIYDQFFSKDGLKMKNTSTVYQLSNNTSVDECLWLCYEDPTCITVAHNKKDGRCYSDIETPAYMGNKPLAHNAFTLHIKTSAVKPGKFFKNGLVYFLYTDKLVSGDAASYACSNVSSIFSLAAVEANVRTERAARKIIREDLFGISELAKQVILMKNEVKEDLTIEEEEAMMLSDKDTDLTSDDYLIVTPKIFSLVNSTYQGYPLCIADPFNIGLTLKGYHRRNIHYSC